MGIVDTAEGDGSVVLTDPAAGELDPVFWNVADLGVTTAKLAALAVTAAKLAADAVTTAKILDANVTAGKLAADAVTTAKIADLNVTTAKINDLAVTTGKLAALAVTAAELAANAVTTAKINDLAVTTAKIDALAVTTAKIAALAVTSAELAANSVTTAKILDANVTTAKLAALAVTAAELAADAVTTAKILDANVTTAKIALGAVTLARMADLAQDAFIIRTTAGAGVPETATCTAAARTVLDDATVAAMVNTLGGAASTGSDGLVRATSPTIVTPTIASFANAAHNHQNAAGGGALDAAAIAAGTVATARLGSGTANASKVLRGDQSWGADSRGADYSITGSDTLTASVIGAGVETAFANLVTIDANTLDAGVLYMVLAFLSYTTSGSAPTINYKLRKDNAAGTLFFDGAALAPGNNMTGENGIRPICLLGTGAPGASVNIYTMPIGRSNHNIDNASGMVTQPVAEATNADLTLALTLTFSANTAGNSVTLNGLYLIRFSV